MQTRGLRNTIAGTLEQNGSFPGELNTREDPEPAKIQSWEFSKNSTVLESGHPHDYGGIVFRPTRCVLVVLDVEEAGQVG